jgi:predicted RNA-binding Zn ribbon-like protein
MRQPGDRAPAPEPLWLVEDLLNTADLEVGRDRLRTVDDLEVFCVDHGLGEIGATPADVAAVRELRETVRDACVARTVPDPLRAAPPDPLRAAPPGAGLVAARVAAAIRAGVEAGTWQRLKVCEAPRCRWAYYDRSPAGLGRWCSMGACGARAKMRAYRARPR